ncbi:MULTISPECIES: IclR family transcriptional regulator C-terminal domain-containing protein [unclassified Streptomyces]|uniref:IclR family transcriptional regulator n=1 Tax=unclassified Streptomyces TaxID=2593676 RepID=UPI002D21911E|nr:IclR family transcriptional regulator C-terminal domain-containing protein [Streptomyces sp. BoleA5]
MHLLLAELTAVGLVERGTDDYRLGLALFELGRRVPHRGLCEAAPPFIEELYEATHENVHLAVVDGADTVVLEKLTGRRSTRITARAGGRLSSYCTATGKALLAHRTPPGLAAVLGVGLRRRTPRTIVVPRLLRPDLVRTRARGYAVNWEEAEVGVSAVAAPSTGRGSARAASPSPLSPSRAPRGRAAGPRRAGGVRGGTGAEPRTRPPVKAISRSAPTRSGARGGRCRRT